MRKVIVISHVSLDGVIQAMGGPDEDPSAKSRSLLCNRFEKFALIIVAYGLFQFACRQFTVWFGHRALAMFPLWFNPIEPGTFAWQLADQQSHAVRLPCLLVMHRDPGPHCLTDMPRRIVPDEQQRPFAFLGQRVGDPLQKLGSDMTDRSSIHEAKRYVSGVGPE